MIFYFDQIFLINKEKMATKKLFNLPKYINQNNVWMFCFVVCNLTIDDKFAEMMNVDSIIKAKYSNFTGYDLWFPNGTQKWTENLSAD